MGLVLCQEDQKLHGKPELMEKRSRVLSIIRPALKPILQAACAKVGSEPCCEWVGEGGSGHYVKVRRPAMLGGDIY